MSLTSQCPEDEYDAFEYGGLPVQSPHWYCALRQQSSSSALRTHRPRPSAFTHPARRPCLVRFDNRSAFEAPRTVHRGAAGEVVVRKNLCPAPDHDGLTKCSERERIYRSTGGGQGSTGRSADLRASIPGDRITKSPCDRRRHCIFAAARGCGCRGFFGWPGTMVSCYERRRVWSIATPGGVQGAADRSHGFGFRDGHHRPASTRNASA
jgi:hypothetical protein